MQIKSLKRDNVEQSFTVLVDTGRDKGEEWPEAGLTGYYIKIKKIHKTAPASF